MTFVVTAINADNKIGKQNFDGDKLLKKSTAGRKTTWQICKYKVCLDTR